MKKILSSNSLKAKIWLCLNSCTISHILNMRRLKDAFSVRKTSQLSIKNKLDKKMKTVVQLLQPNSIQFYSPHYWINKLSNVTITLANIKRLWTTTTITTRIKMPTKLDNMMIPRFIKDAMNKTMTSSRMSRIW